MNEYKQIFESLGKLGGAVEFLTYLQRQIIITKSISIMIKKMAEKKRSKKDE